MVDGRHIYFNSARSGRMEIWRMRPDGSGQEQRTDKVLPQVFQQQRRRVIHPFPLRIPKRLEIVFGDRHTGIMSGFEYHAAKTTASTA